jgi:hypothetical protein
LELPKPERLNARDTADWVLDQFTAGTLILSGADVLALTVGTTPKVAESPVVGQTEAVIATKVAGVSYSNPNGSSRQQIISGCKAGDRLLLQRESSNPHDANAIRVVRVNGPQIGYLPAEVAAELAPHIDRGIGYEAHIDNIVGWDSGTLSVNLLVKPAHAFSGTVSCPPPNVAHAERSIDAGIPAAVVACISCGKPAMQNSKYCIECAACLAKIEAAQRVKTGKGAGCLPTMVLLLIAAVIIYVFHGRKRHPKSDGKFDDGAN